MSILRPYQRQAITAAREAITPDINRVAIEMATGLGKTITFAALIDEYLDGFDGAGNRALVLVHTDQLVRQAVDKIQAVATSQPWTIGVVKAERNDIDADIIVASVQTLNRPGRKEQITDVGLIIVDEGHHAVARSYVEILTHYGAIIPQDCPAHGEFCACLPPPSVPTFGFTATLARTDGRGLGQVWQDLVFSRSLSWGIRHGWLIDLVPYTIKIPGVSASSSDAELDSQLADSIAPEAVVQSWLEKARQTADVWADQFVMSTVLFAPLVRSAQAFTDAFQDAGIKAEVIHGGQPAVEQQAILGRYESGITTVLCNAMILTEGWDSPRTSCVIVARPTQSIPLFIQMVGRGLRPWLSAEAPLREEQRCILLCVAGTTNDLVTVADLSDKSGEVRDGVSFLAMEDEFNLAEDVLPDEDNAYRGPVRIEQWDIMVQRSSKAWKYTEGGTPFLPTAKRSQGYVFVIQFADRSEVWARRPVRRTGRADTGQFKVTRVSTAPDLELAMGLAEDAAQELGGDIGALLADKTRPWRKAVPSMEAISTARRLGVPEKDIQRILTSKAGGKAGKLSDLIDRLTASRVLDHNVQKIRERGNR